MSTRTMLRTMPCPVRVLFVRALLAMVTFTLIIASLARFIPALGAARVRMVEVLRYK